MYFFVALLLLAWNIDRENCQSNDQADIGIEHATSILAPVEDSKRNIMFLDSFQDVENTCQQDKARPFEPIRMNFFMLSSVKKVMNDFGVEMTELVLNETVLLFQQLLSVRRPIEPIQISENECSNVVSDFPDHGVKGTLADLDYVIYVEAIADKTNPCNTQKIIRAIDCGPMDICSKRPLAALVTICNATWKMPHFLVVQHEMVHELIHALGFAEHLFERFDLLSEDGVKLNATETVTRIWRINNIDIEHNVTLIVTPTVKKFVQEHFSCQSLEGAELENEGGEDVALSHWEKRIFGIEMMTATRSDFMLLSNLTLALLDDSGWYQTNKSAAKILPYGKGYGCDFAQRSCGEYIADKTKINPHMAFPFCTWDDYRSTHLNDNVPLVCKKRQQLERCDWRTIEDNDDFPFRYFADKQFQDGDKKVNGANVIGAHPLTDGCPIVELASPESDDDNFLAASICKKLEMLNKKAKLAITGGICIDTNDDFKLCPCNPLESAYNNIDAGCYQYECKSGRLMIKTLYSDHVSESKLEKYEDCSAQNKRIRVRRRQMVGPDKKERSYEDFVRCPLCWLVCENNPLYPGFTCYTSGSYNFRWSNSYSVCIIEALLFLLVRHDFFYQNIR